jgi:hypothetical protein
LILLRETILPNETSLDRGSLMNPLKKRDD